MTKKPASPQTIAPYQGAIPPASPDINKQYPPEIRAGMNTLYERPMPKGPAPIPVKQSVGLNVVGRGPVIHVLAGRLGRRLRAGFNAQTALAHARGFRFVVKAEVTND